LVAGSVLLSLLICRIVCSLSTSVSFQNIVVAIYCTCIKLKILIMCNEVIHVLSVELINHFIFADTFEGFDTRVLEVSTIILNL
jgi:hypothetical protein